MRKRTAPAGGVVSVLFAVLALAGPSGCGNEENPHTLWIGEGPAYGTLALVDVPPVPF